MADRKLKVTINSEFNKKGFNEVDKAVEKTKKNVTDMGSLVNSNLGKLVAGYFTLSFGVQQYGKAIEAANVQLEQENKLASMLETHGYTNEQIKSVKEYAGELQKVGIIGDEVTLAGVNQIASLGLQEENLKKVTWAIDELAVKQAGYNADISTTSAAGKLMVQALNGQTSMLERYGIKLTESQQMMIKFGNENQKVKALVDAVRKSIGNINEELAATPMGKIIQAQNNIGDVYEEIAMMFMKTRVNFYEFIDDNLDVISQFIESSIKFTQEISGSFGGIVKEMGSAFKEASPEIKLATGLLAAFVLVDMAPIAAGVVAVNELWGAFHGYDSVVEDAYNSIKEFFELETDFEQFKGIVLAGFDDIGVSTEALVTSLGGAMKLLVDSLASVGKLVTGDFAGASKYGKKALEGLEDMFAFVDPYENLRKKHPERYKKMMEENRQAAVEKYPEAATALRAASPSMYSPEKMGMVPISPSVMSESVVDNRNITINQGAITINEATNPEEIKRVLEQYNSDKLEQVRLRRPSLVPR